MAPMTPRLKILSGSSHPRLSLSQTFSALFNISPFSLPHLFLVAHPARFFPLHDARAVLASLRLPACRVTTPSIPSCFLHRLALPALPAASATPSPTAPQPLCPLDCISGAFFPFYRSCPLVVTCTSSLLTFSTFYECDQLRRGATIHHGR